MTITFVTAFLNLQEERPNEKSIETCINHFVSVASSGISIVAFLSKEYIPLVEERHLENVKCIPIELDELETYKETKECGPLDIPPFRSTVKDTHNFMILMNAKVELMHKAIRQDLFHTERFAWIDFSIAYVLKNIPSSTSFLTKLSNASIEPGLYFPGCWEKHAGYSQVYTSIHWRFCGGFFLGDKESLLEMYNLYRITFKTILQAKSINLWEVNIWTILEAEYGWLPTWYKADHNDTIFYIPEKYFSLA
jgi:hypothetical protein